MLTLTKLPVVTSLNEASTFYMSMQPSGIQSTNDIYSNQNVYYYANNGVGTFNVNGTINASSILVNGAPLTVSGGSSGPTVTVTATNGLYSIGNFTGSYTDGIVVDYVTGNGRISVGPGDGLTIYNGGVANTALVTIANTGNFSIGTASNTYALNVGGTANVGALLINGAPLSGGATITDDTTTNATRYIMLGSATSGTYSAANTSSSKLYFNPSTGTTYSTVFQSLSDETQKTNVEPIVNATDTLKQIIGYEFDWKDNGLKSAGVIAQQLEKILPWLVSETDGIKSVNYAGLLAYLIQSNKELADRIEKLESK